MYFRLYNNVSGLVATAQDDTYFNKLEEVDDRKFCWIWIDEYRIMHNRLYFIENINKNCK